MKNSFRFIFTRVFITAMVSGFAVYSFLLRFTDFLIMSRGGKAFTLGGLWVGLTLFTLLIFTEPVARLIESGKAKHNLWILAISALIVALVVPSVYKFPQFPRSFTLEISSAASENLSADGKSITILSIKRINLPSRTKTPLIKENLSLEGDWIVEQERSRFTLGAGRQGLIRYENFVQGYVTVAFLTGPDQGEVVVDFNGKTNKLVLYADSAGQIEQDFASPNTWANADPVRRALLAGGLIANLVLSVMVIFFSGLVVFHLVFSRRLRAKGLWSVVLVVLLTPVLLFLVNSIQKEVRFSDPVLEAAVRETIHKPVGDIRSHDLLSVIELDVLDEGVKSLEGIGALRNLRVLNASGNSISDFTPLSRLVKLQELYLGNNRIDDLSSLPALPELVRLDLSGNQITDIQQVSQFRNLQNLDLSRNMIMDIAPVANLRHLERLNLRDNDVRDVSALAGLNRLTYLNLHSNISVADLSPVGGLTGLQTLILRNVPVGNQISILSDLRSLEYLNIRNCSVGNFDVIADLMKTGTLQQNENTGREVTINLLENGFPVDGSDLFTSLRPYWGNVTYRYPYLLPYFPGKVVAPVFSQEGGFYSDTLNLVLTTEEQGGRIFYTIDGTEPAVDKEMHPSGTTLEYTQPIRLENRSRMGGYLSGIETSRFWRYTPDGVVFTGNVIRAVTIDEEMGRSEVVTQSYFIDEDVTKRYSFPVVSITTDPGGFFDEKSGIYVPGALYEDLYTNLTLNPANYSQRGLEWERHGHLELFSPDGEKKLSQPIAIRVHGDASRAYSQKSLRIYAIGQDEGAPDVFSYDFFPALSQRLTDAGVNTHDVLVLRNSGQDWNGTFFKDALIHSLLENTKLDIQGAHPVIVFLNGEYWGIHNARNHYNSSYFNTYYGIDDGVTLVYDGATPEVRIGEIGDDAHFQQLLQIIDVEYRLSGYRTVDTLKEQGRYDRVADMMDLDNFIDYYVTQIYIKNNDLQVYRWRKTSGAEKSAVKVPYGYDGKWRWMVRDTDLGFSDPAFNTLDYLTMEENPSTYLLRSLLENPDFRTDFINRFADLLNTNFREEYVVSRIDEHENRYAPEMREQISRWGKPAPDYRSWRNNVEVLRAFARLRPGYQRNQLLEFFDLDGLAKLTIKTDGRSGHVRVNTIDVQPGTPGVDIPAVWSGQYFKGIPIKLTAIAEPGYRFSHWEGLSLGISTETELEVSLERDLTLTAVFTRLQ